MFISVSLFMLNQMKFNLHTTSRLLCQIISTCVSDLSDTVYRQPNCSNESEAILPPRSKYEVSHVIKTWQKK